MFPLLLSTEVRYSVQNLLTKISYFQQVLGKIKILFKIKRSGRYTLLVYISLEYDLLVESSIDESYLKSMAALNLWNLHPGLLNEKLVLAQTIYGY